MVAVSVIVTATMLPHSHTTYQYLWTTNWGRMLLLINNWDTLVFALHPLQSSIQTSQYVRPLFPPPMFLITDTTTLQSLLPRGLHWLVSHRSHGKAALMAFLNIPAPQPRFTLDNGLSSRPPTPPHLTREQYWEPGESLYITMGKCKKDATPLLTHWSYVFLALTHR